MNKTVPRLIWLLILMILAVPIKAAEVRPAIPTSLSEAMRMAVLKRPELRMELAQEAMARSRIKEARGNFLPTLDLTASHYYLDNFDDFTGIKITSQIAGQNVLVDIEKELPQYQLNSELSLVYNLYAGGRDQALLREAQSRLASNHFQEASTLRKIRLEVTKAYWELKKSQMEFAMAKRELALVRLEVKVAATRHGYQRMSDVEYAAVKLKNREKEMSLRIADRNCLRAYGTYQHVLDLPEDIPATSAESIPELLDDPGEEIPAAEESPHPDIQKLNSEIRSADHRAAMARSLHFPSVDLFAKYSLVGRDANSYWDSWQDAHSDFYMVGLKVTTNLFNGFRTQERIHQAEEEVRLRKLQLHQKNRELAEAERSRKTALETTLDRLELAMERQKLEESEERSARSQLESGRLSELEYRQKAVELENAGDHVMLARIDAALARAALQWMVIDAPQQ